MNQNRKQRWVLPKGVSDLKPSIVVLVASIIVTLFPLVGGAQVSPLTLQPATGNVGIGTATPVYALSIYRNSSGTTSNVETGVNGAVAQTRFAGLTDGAATRVWGSGLNITNGNGGYELYDYTAGASRFYINTSGNVGIGTLTPAYALSVYRAVSAATSNVETGVNGAVAQTRFAGLTDGAATRVWGSGLNITNGNGGYELYDYTASASRFYINTSGNVGIGTVNPTSLLEVNGTFSATTKNFQIDHPLDRERKLLVHSALEGPEVAVFYRGEAELKNGETVIQLPSYFEALTRKENRTVQLTPIGGWAALYVEEGVKDGKFTVKSANTATTTLRFYWEIKAVRADVAPLVVEKAKADSEKLAQAPKN